MAETPDSPNRVSMQEVMMKLDTHMTRVPIKLQESMEQILEARQIMLSIFNVYEKGIAEKEKQIKDWEAYSKGLEELLTKSNISFLPFGQKPASEPASTEPKP